MWLGLLLIVVPSLALLALESYLVIGNAPQLKRNRELVVRTFEMITSAQALQRAVQDAERGQRGYLLTGDPAYLAPYRRGVEDTPGLLERLRQFEPDNPEHQRRMASLDLQIRYKLAELRQSLEIRDAQGFDAARNYVRMNLGRDTMDAVTALIEGAIAGENFRLTDQQERAAADERRTAMLTATGGALAVSIMALGTFMGWLSLRRIDRADAARRETENRFQLIVEAIADHAICMLDTRGNITTWNAAAERITGFSTAEILGRHFSVFHTPEDRAAGLPEHALDAARGGTFETEAWRMRRDGERYFASVVMNPVHDDAGSLVGYAKITRDISERLRQQQAIEQARAELAQSQKMEALGQLSGGIAHDFNNVLHVINNAVAILRRKLGDTGADAGRMLDMIARNADRAAGLTQRLLAFSRTQPLDPMPADPNALVAGMAELLRQTLGDRIQVRIAPGTAIRPVLVDANQLETAIVNLALNARDAMPRGGVLSIATSMADLDAAYAATHPGAKAGTHVLIAVGDTGTGMSEAVLSRAFDPFFTTKAVGKGTGLGLSQVFGFIRQSGGHVAMRSTLGEGTTVNLYLPAIEEPAVAPSSPEAAAAPASRPPARILVVEDNDDIRAFTAQVLSAAGHRVRVAADANGAMAALETEVADLLFTDVGLPNGRNGQELSADARARWPALRVLYATAFADRAFQERLGADEDVLLKPFDQAALEAAVARTLESLPTSGTPT